MRKISFLLLLCCLIRYTAMATVFTVRNFSKDYYGKINIDDTSQVFSPGWIAIYDQKTNKELIRVTSEELALTLHDGQPVANIKELPYGEQSLIIYEDVNFDGIRDLAIEDGQNSCYHGPSFQVYLGTKNGFTEDADFTRLAQEYCGMFEINTKDKTLSTMTKSGCCWHQFSVYKVIGNKPVAIKVSELDQTHFPYTTETLEVHEGKKVTKTTTRTLDKETEGIKPILSFRLENNNKEVLLFSYENSLHYCFSDEKGHIEFAYPADTENENPVFKRTGSGGRIGLTFTNKDARYELVETDKGPLELIVTTNKRIYRSVGKAGQTGSLKNIPAKLDNVQ